MLKSHKPLQLQGYPPTWTVGDMRFGTSCCVRCLHYIGYAATQSPLTPLPPRLYWQKHRAHIQPVGLPIQLLPIPLPFFFPTYLSSSLTLEKAMDPAFFFF